LYRKFSISIKVPLTPLGEGDLGGEGKKGQTKSPNIAVGAFNIITQGVITE
jgi:hypothetical protein